MQRNAPQMRARWESGFFQNEITAAVRCLFALADHLKRGGDFFLHFFAGLKFNGSACGNWHVLIGIFWVAPDLRLHLADLECAEIPHHHGVALRERFRNFIDQGLNDLEHVLLGDFQASGSQIVGDFDNEFALGDSGHWKRIAGGRRKYGKVYSSFMAAVPLKFKRTDAICVP